MNRLITLIISVVSISGNLFSQSAWENVPQATQFSPIAIDFTDLNNGWATTVSGYIAHTNDGGSSWSLQGNYVAGSGGSIDMISPTHGYATGLSKILETTDGEHWNEILLDTESNVIGSINFLNDTLGLVSVSGYMVWRTTNGGQSWDTIYYDPGHAIGKVLFIDENTIIGVGATFFGSGNIIVTHDGGLTWAEPQEAIGLTLTDVYFTNNQTGYIVGNNGVYLTTTDGGLTWQNSNQFQNLLQPYPSIYFTSATTGYVTADYGQCFRTTDSGNTWTDMSFMGNRNYTSIHFNDSLHGWAASSVLTEIISTSDGGVTWSSLYTGSGWGLTDIEFPSNSEGWACGIRGTVMHTLDGGNTWSLIESPSDVSFTNIGIADPQNIWVIGATGVGFHTPNGGANWYYTQVSPQGGDLMDIDFPSPQVGYIVGPSYIHKTLNGGVNWVADWNPGINYMAVSFLNVDTGMVCTTEAIYKTSNGGASWEEVTPTVGINAYNDIAYPAQDTAYVVGYQGIILSTYDGGNMWTLQNSGTTSVLTDVTFSSSTNGRASGYDGTILVTLDAGVTWLPESTPSQVQISAIAITPDNDGWATKQDGNFLKFHCSAVGSIDVDSYTLSPADNCNGSVKLASVSGESFVASIAGQNQVINSSADLSGLCEGRYSLTGYTSCGNGLNGQFVIPNPGHFYGTTAFGDSAIAFYIGTVLELCDQQLSSASFARLISASHINANTIQAGWEIITASGTIWLPVLYEIGENGIYAIQLSLYCEDNSFEGLVVNEKIYIEDNTVVLKTSEFQTESFSVFPNPASDNITIRFESGIANLTIRDINGKELLSKEITSNDQVDLSGLSSGIFLFEITTGNETTVKRIIKN